MTIPRHLIFQGILRCLQFQSLHSSGHRHISEFPLIVQGCSYWSSDEVSPGYLLAWIQFGLRDTQPPWHQTYSRCPGSPTAESPSPLFPSQRGNYWTENLPFCWHGDLGPLRIFGLVCAINYCGQKLHLPWLHGRKLSCSLRRLSHCCDGSHFESIRGKKDVFNLGTGTVGSTRLWTHWKLLSKRHSSARMVTRWVGGCYLVAPNAPATFARSMDPTIAETKQKLKKNPQIKVWTIITTIEFSLDLPKIWLGLRRISLLLQFITGRNLKPRKFASAIQKSKSSALSFQHTASV